MAGVCAAGPTNASVPASSPSQKMGAPSDHSHARKRCLVATRSGSLKSAYWTGDVLGEGTYGKVATAVSISSGCVRAVKTVKETEEVDQRQLANEIAIHRELHHPNVVSLYEVFTRSSKVHLVMELCRGGELYDRIQEEGWFDEWTSARYLRQVLGVTHYLHTSRVVHRDMKPENLMLRSSEHGAQLKLIDFGFARSYVPGSGPMFTAAGSLYYMAPQVLRGAYNEKCDVWGCGVIAYMMLCGYPPFQGDDNVELSQAVRCGKFEFASPDWDGISNEAKDMVTQMLTFDASRRPAAGVLLQSPWLVEPATDDLEGADANGMCARFRNFVGASPLRRLALAVAAARGALGDDELEAARLAFMRVDTDGNGYVSFADLCDMLGEVATDAETQLRSCDMSDARMDWAEFLALWADGASLGALDGVVAAETFKVLGDAEAEIGVEALGRVVGDRGLATELLKDVGVGQGRQLGFEEFRSLLLLGGSGADAARLPSGSAAVAAA